MFTSNIFDSAKLSLKVYKRSSAATPEMKEQMKQVQDFLQSAGKMSSRQLKYQLTKISNVFVKYRKVENELHKQWLSIILEHSIIESAFNSAGVILSQEILPKTLFLAQKKICQKLLSTSS